MGQTILIAEPGKQEVIVQHTFDAPRSLVFQLYTDPARLPLWWGPATLTTHVEQMEVRPGGLWRVVQAAPDGSQYIFHGVYHAVVPPERLVYTFEYEGAAGHVLLETITFAEQSGRTLLTDLSIFQSIADRDGMLQAGMEEGTTESMQRFEALLARALVR